MAEPVTWGVDEARRYLRCNADTVRRKAAEGSIPGRRLGRRWLFDPEQLKAYVRGEWHSISDHPAGLGGLDSQYAVSLFGEAPEPRNAKKPKNTKRRLELVSGGRSI